MSRNDADVFNITNDLYGDARIHKTDALNARMQIRLNNRM